MKVKKTYEGKDNLLVLRKLMKVKKTQEGLENEENLWKVEKN